MSAKFIGGGGKAISSHQYIVLCILKCEWAVWGIRSSFVCAVSRDRKLAVESLTSLIINGVLPTLTFLQRNWI